MLTRRFLILFALAAVTIFSGCDRDSGGKQSASPAPQGLLGQQAPDLSLSDLNGEIVSLSQYQGQVVMVNFWATWCPPCREEMPSMQNLHNKLKERGLVILAINVDEGGKDGVVKFIDKYKYSFPVLLDSKREAQSSYGVFAYPETYLIDRNGVVVEKVIGAREWDSGALFKKINFLIEG